MKSRSDIDCYTAQFCLLNSNIFHLYMLKMEEKFFLSSLGWWVETEFGSTHLNILSNCENKQSSDMPSKN